MRQTAEGLYFQRHGYSGFYCLRAVPGHVFGTDWQILYSLRIVRILAIFKLARFNETAASFKKAFYLIRDEFFLFFSVILFMLYVTSLGIYIAEHDAQPEKFRSFLTRSGLPWKR